MIGSLALLLAAVAAAANPGRPTTVTSCDAAAPMQLWTATAAGELRVTDADGTQLCLDGPNVKARRIIKGSERRLTER